MIKRKRGRPFGSKNKTSLPRKVNKSLNSPDTFKKTLDEWDRMEEEANKVDWQSIAKKQEERINMYIIENEEIAKICMMRWEEIQHLKYLVKYLEGRNEDSSV
jgi:hypothetical protein